MKFLVFATALLVGGIASATCKEGTYASFPVLNGTSDHYVHETRKCVNGTFMTAAEKADYQKKQAGQPYPCKEGTKTTFRVASLSSDKGVEVVRTCVNGSFMNAQERAAYWAKQNGQPYACKEGARALARKGDYFDVLTESEGRQEISVVCVNGKYVP